MRGSCLHSGRSLPRRCRARSPWSRERGEKARPHELGAAAARARCAKSDADITAAEAAIETAAAEEASAASEAAVTAALRALDKEN